jgi:hypothetical protein
MPVTALLDADLFPKTITHNLEIVPHTGRSANALLTLGVWTPVRRSLSGKSQEESDAIYSNLEQIAGMTKNGCVVVYDSDETFFECLYLKPPSLRGTPFDVFRGVERKRVRGPMRRTYMLEGSFLEEHARFLQKKRNDRWYQLLENIQHPRFLELKKRTGGHHLADLYHVWTAEENALDCFITLDTAFLNAVTLWKPEPLDTPVRLFTPRQFLQWIAAKLYLAPAHRVRIW